MRVHRIGACALKVSEASLAFCPSVSSKSSRDSNSNVFCISPISGPGGKTFSQIKTDTDGQRLMRTYCRPPLISLPQTTMESVYDIIVDGRTLLKNALKVIPSL